MHVRSVTRLAGVGHIPGHPIGYGQRKRWLFYISELDEWLRAQVCSESPGVVKAKEDKLPRRNRYQFGNLELRKRTKGPDVWLFRYWDRENPSATRPSVTLGTVEDYPTQADARRAAEGLRLEINNGLPVREAVTFQGLIDRYVSEEIERGDLAHTTKEPDLNRINKHISPKWGMCLLREVKPYPIQEWLRKLPMAPKTRGHIRGLMYRLFEKAMLWELIPLERNPMGLVELRGVSKRLKPPRILTEEEFGALLNELVHPYRCMVLLAGCTGLRISEVMGLRWTGINFESLAMEIREGYARSQVTKLKSECSQDELPLDRMSQPFCSNGSGSAQRRLEIGSFRAREQTNPTILARYGRRYSKPLHYEPIFRDRLAGTRCVTATAHGSTRPVLLSACSRNSCVTPTSRPR